MNAISTTTTSAGNAETRLACGGCGLWLAPGDPCPICAAFNRMRALLDRRKGRGNWLERSQPKVIP